MRRTRIYPGWWLVLALALTETVSFGVLYYAFTVFVAPMSADLGVSTAAIAGAYSIGVLVSGLAAGFVGAWLDRHGARVLMTVGSVGAGALLMAWSYVADLTQLYVVWALMGLVLAAVLYEPAFAVLAVWFDRRRGAALTLLTFVAGFASVVFLPLAGTLVEAHGWRQALRILAWVVWAVTVPLHALVLRRRPSDLGVHVDGDRPEDGVTTTFPRRAPSRPARPRSVVSAAPGAAFASPAFRWLTLAFTASMMVIVAVGVHLVPMLQDRGLGAVEAAAVGGAIGLMALPGRLIFTPLGSVWSRHVVAALIFVAQATGLAALLVIPGPAGVTAFVIAYGVGFGAITPARAALVAETFGAAWYGTIAGRMSLIGTLGRASAPVALGWLVGASDSFDLALGALIVLSLVAALAVVVAGVRRPAR